MQVSSRQNVRNEADNIRRERNNATPANCELTAEYVTLRDARYYESGNMMRTAEIISPILPDLLTDEEIKCLQDRPEHTNYVLQQLEMDAQERSTTDVLTTRRLTHEIESRGRDKPWIYWTTLIAIVILMNVISVVFLVKWRTRHYVGREEVTLTKR
jgi:hypothetical protein